MYISAFLHKTQGQLLKNTLSLFFSNKAGTILVLDYCWAIVEVVVFCSLLAVVWIVLFIQSTLELTGERQRDRLMEETDFWSIKGCLALRGNLQMNNRFFLIDIKICCGLGLVYMNCIKKFIYFYIIIYCSKKTAWIFIFDNMLFIGHLIILSIIK